MADAWKSVTQDAPVIDPTLEASEIALLKGLLKVLQGDGTGALPVEIAGSSTTGTVPTSLENSDIMVPVDIQNRYSKTIQTHNAVSIGQAGKSYGNWIDCQSPVGFDKIAVTLLNDASTSNNIEIQWSNDGVSAHGWESVATVSSMTQRSGITEIKARYARVVLANNDTAAHIMAAWAYLKV